MRAVVQRVTYARVKADSSIVAEIGKGLLVFVGVAEGDSSNDSAGLAHKVVGLRVFHDEEGRMTDTLARVQGSILVVSQFTLLGDCRRGARPTFLAAAPWDVAEPLIGSFVDSVRELGVDCRVAAIRERVDVELLNDGPITLLLDTKKAF